MSFEKIEVLLKNRPHVINVDNLNPFWDWLKELEVAVAETKKQLQEKYEWWEKHLELDEEAGYFTSKDTIELMKLLREFLGLGESKK